MESKEDVPSLRLLYLSFFKAYVDRTELLTKNERETTTLAERRAALPKNVHCRRRVRTTECGAPIDVDVAFEEAERMFKVLCPNKKFLPERNASTSNGNADDQGNKEMEEEEEDDSDMSGLDSDDDYGV